MISLFKKSGIKLVYVGIGSGDSDIRFKEQQLRLMNKLIKSKN